MSKDLTTIREIAWRDVFPWLILLRVFRLSIRPSVLLLALLPTLVMPWGEQLARLTFIPDERTEAIPESPNASTGGRPGATNERHSTVEESVGSAVTSSLDPLRLAPQIGRQRIEPLFRQLTRPFREILRAESLPRTAYWVFVGLWGLLLWAIPAGAISRIAVVRIGREERVGFVESIVFASRRFGAYVGAPLLPMIGVALFAVPIAVVGLMMRSDWGLLFAAGCWVLVLMAGFAMSLMLLGLLFGWPLMWPTISAEFNGDLFEALQRGYDYTRERPLQYLFYAITATMLGALGWLVVNAVCSGIVDLSFWAASWGTGVDRLADIKQWESQLRLDLFHLGPPIESGTEPAAPTNSVAMVGLFVIHGLNTTLANQLPAAYAAGFFWCSASAIYLLLRQDVDQTEIDEVFSEEAELVPALDGSITTETNAENPQQLAQPSSGDLPEGEIPPASGTDVG